MLEHLGGGLVKLVDL